MWAMFTTLPVGKLFSDTLKSMVLFAESIVMTAVRPGRPADPRDRGLVRRGTVVLTSRHGRRDQGARADRRDRARSRHALHRGRHPWRDGDAPQSVTRIAP